MKIANRMEWDDEVTAKVAEALDKMGFEEVAIDYLDTHADPSGDYGLEWYIQKRFDPMYERFYDGAGNLNRLFISESKFYVTQYNMVGYDQIAQAYIDAYHDYRGIGRGQTSRNSKTSLKTNQKKPAPKRKPTQRRK